MKKSDVDQKPGLWGALRGALFESEDERKPTSASVAPASAATSAAGADAEDAGHAQEQTVKDLAAAAMSSPSPYTRLLQAAMRLESYIENEAARFKGAISVGDGLTPTDVLRSIDHQHIADLDKEVARREGMLAQQMQEEVTRRLDGVADLKAKAAASEQEAARLKADFESRMARMKQADEERSRVIAEMVRQADEQKALIEQAQRQLLASASQVRSMLITMRDKLAGYLSA